MGRVRSAGIFALALTAATLGEVAQAKHVIAPKSSYLDVSARRAELRANGNTRVAYALQHLDSSRIGGNTTVLAAPTQFSTAATTNASANVR